MVIRKILRLFIFLQLIMAAVLSVSSTAYSGEIVVRPGKFDHFNISIPETIIAGEEAIIKIEAVDAFNNLLTDFGGTGKEFLVSVSGSASVKPSTLKSSSFVTGTATLTLLDKIAETVNLSIRESGFPIPILTKDLSIAPNKLNSFVIKGPRSVQAGERFNLVITAKDAFGNTVLEPIFGKNLNLIFKGNAEPKIDMPAIPDFKKGDSVIFLVSQKAGTTIIEAKDLITGSFGISDKIDITNGPVNSFKVFAPKEVIAGEPFEVLIVAVDRFNNVVTNYSTTGSSIVIGASGKLRPFPSTLPAYEFVTGQAKVALRYDISEDISLLVTEMGKTQRGTSDIIKVVSPIAERFEVITPESAVAGQKFKIKVTVYNQIGNVIRNYNMVGQDVQLSTTGTGVLLPNRIPASEFVNGTAVVEVQYNKSEAFTITASQVEPPVQPQVKKPAPATSKEAAKASPKEPKKVKEAKPKKEVKEANKEKKAKAEAKPLEITTISLVEPKKKSTISIHIPNFKGTGKYNVYTETIEGKKWIILKVKPAVNKVEKPVKFDSSFIRRVLIEEDKKEKEAVLIRIEQLKPSRFHITKEQDSLVVTLKH